MNKKLLLKHLVSLMFFIFIANSLALKFYWYSLVWYFDIIMHTLGGMWVGMFFLYVFERREYKPLTIGLFLRVMACVLLVGLLWEMYEFYIFQHLSRNTFDLTDTLSDVGFDLLGGALSGLYFLKIIMRKLRDRVQSSNGSR